MQLIADGRRRAKMEKGEGCETKEAVQLEEGIGERMGNENGTELW